MPFLDHMVCQHVTISMGVVNKTVESGYSLAEFISSADNNLYVAKKNGKTDMYLSSAAAGSACKERKTSRIHGNLKVCFSSVKIHMDSCKRSCDFGN